MYYYLLKAVKVSSSASQTNIAFLLHGSISRDKVLKGVCKYQSVWTARFLGISIKIFITSCATKEGLLKDHYVFRLELSIIITIWIFKIKKERTMCINPSNNKYQNNKLVPPSGFCGTIFQIRTHETSLFTIFKTIHYSKSILICTVFNRFWVNFWALLSRPDSLLYFIFRLRYNPNHL